jgi:hypothetical protein
MILANLKNILAKHFDRFTPMSISRGFSHGKTGLAGRASATVAAHRWRTPTCLSTTAPSRASPEMGSVQNCAGSEALQNAHTHH